MSATNPRDPKCAGHLIVLAVCLCLAAFPWMDQKNGDALAQGPLGDSTYMAHLNETWGVLLDPAIPRGDCRQCHVSHEESVPNANNLFTENNNYLCFSPEGIGGCHASQPSGGSFGYPASETDKFPQGMEWFGYFEANNGGIEQHGVLEQVRWPGQLTWENPIYSVHALDQDMPLQDNLGQGSCSNCHNVHQGVGPHDLLVDSVGPIQPMNTSGPPTSQNLCLGCHSTSGPPGMNPSGRFIRDYYDNAMKQYGSRSGHAFVNSYGPIQAGTKLPCYECHNPHGSQGSTGANPNGYLISDQRPGWYGLTDIRNDADQARRFCTGCHPYSDGGGGGVVLGVTLPPMPDHDGHRRMDHQHCMEQHGMDYSRASSNNVHNPIRESN